MFFLLTQLLTKSLPTDVFAVLFVNGDTPMKIGPQKIWGEGGSKCAFSGVKIQTPPSSDGRCVETRWNFGKTKITDINYVCCVFNKGTVSRLPSYPHLVKFSSGHLSYRGAHKLCILANGP